MWPMVSFLVEEKQLGSAYGVMQAIQNLGLAVTGQISGVLIDSFEDKNESYQWLIVLFLGFQAICLVSILWLWKRHGVNCEPIGGNEKIDLVKKQIKEQVHENSGFDVDK